MIEVPILDGALRALAQDYAWYCKDPVGMQSGRLELLCTRIEAVISEYDKKTRLPLKPEQLYANYE